MRRQNSGRILCVWLVAVATGASAFAQETPLRLPKSSAASEVSDREARLADKPGFATVPPSPVETAPATFCPIYRDWIVSARNCPEKRTHCQSCDFSVTQLDLCGRATTSSLAELLAGLQPEVPVCFVVHGSFVKWPDVCAESRQAQNWLRQACPGRPLHIVFFTWPSDVTLKALFPVDVLTLGRRAGRHAQDLAEIIAQISPDHPLCLLGHSHGARMVVATLHLLAGGSIDGIGCPGGPYQGHRIRAVLAAAAFDHEWFNPGERYDRALYRPEGILNLKNRHDLALAFYPLHRPGAARPLARTGLTAGDRRELGVWQAKLLEVDVTHLVGRSHYWTTYLDQPAIAQTISPYIFFTDAR